MHGESEVASVGHRDRNVHRLLGELRQGPVHAIAMEGLLMIRLQPGWPVRLDAEDSRAKHVFEALSHALGDPFEDRLVVRGKVRELLCAKCGHDAPFIDRSDAEIY